MKKYVTWLTINRQCNLTCYWCYQKQLLSSRDRMSLDLAKRLIDLSIGIGSQKIILIGGEPTIHPDFLEIVRRCNAVEVTLLTNGIAFASRDFCQSVEDAGLKAVSTSLKGASEKDYVNGCGGKEVFKKVMQAIENIEKTGMRHQVSITVSRSVINNWDAIPRLMRECGATSFSFSFERPIMTGEDMSFDDSMLPGNIIPFIEKVMYPSLKETGKDFDLNVTFPQCHFSSGFLAKARDEGHAVAGCQLLMDSGVIFDPDGRVLMCNHITDHPLGEYGKDFRTIDEMVAWRNSPDIRKFYEVAGAPPGAQCEECSSWSGCGAGCRIFWIYKGADVLLPVNSTNNKANKRRPYVSEKLHDATV